MKKITILLTLFLVSVGVGVSQAQAQAVSSVSELSNSAVYTLKTNRNAETDQKGYLMYNESSPNNVAANYGAYASVAFDATNAAFHWAIYKSAKTGNYYFYSVKGQKFIASSTDGGSTPVALSATPENEVGIRTSAAAATEAGYPFLLSTNHWALNTAGSNFPHGVVSWGDGFSSNNDGGNVYKITKVGELTAAMQTAIESAVATYEAANYVTELSQLSNSAIYTLKTNRNDAANLQGHLMYHTDCPDYLASNYGSGYPNYVFNKSDEAFQWAIYKSAKTQKYYFYSIKGQKFIASSTDGGSKPVSLSAAPLNDLEIRMSTKAGDGYPFLLSTNQWALNTALTAGAHGVVSWGGGYGVKDDPGNVYKIMKVGELSDETLSAIESAVTTFEDVTSVTYVYKIGNREYTQRTVDQNKNTAPNAPAVPFVTINGYDVTTIGNGATATVNVDCTEKLPFLTSASADNANWYTLDIHSNRPNNFLKFFAEDEINFKVKEGSVNPVQMDDSYLWRFVGNLFDGFKVYNKAAGSEKTLGWAGSYFTLDTPADTRGDLFKLAASTADASGFCLTLDDINYMNYNAANEETKKNIATYDQRDAGSTILVADYSTLIINSADRYLGIPVGAVGSSKTVDEAFKAQLSEAVNAVKAGMTSDNFSTLETLLKSIDVENTHEMVVGGLYRLQNYARKDANGNGWMIGLDANNSRVKLSLDKKDLSQIWKFEDCTENEEQGYKISSPNSGAYMSTAADNSLLDNYAAGGRYRLVSLGDAQFNIKDGNNSNVVIYGGGAIGNWSSNPKDSDGAWFVIAATDIEVALNTADGKSYSTVYLPFDVEATGSTKAYYAKEIGGTDTEKTITMTETPDNKVKALQGALLVNEAAEATAVLNIVADAAEPAQTNLLKGSCTAVTKDAGTVYVFGNGSAGVGFYRNNGDLKANRAYVDEAEGVMLVMKFGGETTGIIDGVQAEGAGAAPLYDLSGRRVVKAGKGVYISNGKKIYVK